MTVARADSPAVHALRMHVRARAVRDVVDLATKAIAGLEWIAHGDDERAAREAHDALVVLGVRDPWMAFEDRRR